MKSSVMLLEQRTSLFFQDRLGVHIFMEGLLFSVGVLSALYHLLSVV